MPILMSLDQGSAVLGWSSAKGYRVASAGDFPGAVRLGRRWYVRREKLRRFLADEPEPQPAEPTAAAPDLRVVRAVGDRRG